MRDNFSDVWWLYSPIYCRIGTGASGRTCICCIFFAVGLWKTIVVSADLGLLGILFSSFRTVSWEMVCLTTSVTSPLLSLRVLIWQLRFYSSSRRNKRIRRYVPFIHSRLKWQLNTTSRFNGLIERFKFRCFHNKLLTLEINCEITKMGQSFAIFSPSFSSWCSSFLYLNVNCSTDSPRSCWIALNSAGNRRHLSSLDSPNSARNLSIQMLSFSSAAFP